VTLLLAALVLRETPRQRVRFDAAGAIALALAVGGCPTYPRTRTGN
jgi:hypothetical protein